MKDDLDGIFEHLTPDDFSDETTAIGEVGRVNHGAEAFNGFVDEQVRALRISYSAAAGEINPVATLANDVVQRMFLPDEEETVGGYFDRLRDEATQMKATWLFVARRTRVGSQLVERDQMPDATENPMIAQADAEGLLKEGVIWYGESREAGEVHRRLGILFDDGRGNLEKPIESTNQRIAAFERILG